MLEALRKRRDEEGFTLIELMVVVLIIGILVAIAVPTFLNAQNNAKSKAAQSNARSGLSAGKTVFAEKETYAIAIGDLTAAEPSLNFLTVGAPSTAPDEISWAVNTAGTQLTIAVKAKNNDCFYIRDNVDPADTANRGTYFGKKVNTNDTTCDADHGTQPVYFATQSKGWPSSGASSTPTTAAP